MTHQAITPDTDLAKLPRLDRRVSVGRAKIYLCDADTGKELTSHPLHGASWCGAGPMARDNEGKFIRGTITRVHIVTWQANGPRTGEISADTFPGQRVKVSTWHGTGHSLNEMRTLHNNA